MFYDKVREGQITEFDEFLKVLYVELGASTSLEDVTFTI